MSLSIGTSLMRTYSTHIGESTQSTLHHDTSDMNSTSVPLIIFLQGGPGAASQFSAFNYIGPVKVIGKGDDMHP